MLSMHLPGMLYSKKCKLIQKLKVARSAPFLPKHKHSDFAEKSFSHHKYIMVQIIVLC